MMVKVCGRPGCDKGHGRSLSGTASVRKNYRVCRYENPDSKGSALETAFRDHFPAGRSRAGRPFPLARYPPCAKGSQCLLWGQHTPWPAPLHPRVRHTVLWACRSARSQCRALGRGSQIWPRWNHVGSFQNPWCLGCTPEQ